MSRKNRRGAGVESGEKSEVEFGEKSEGESGVEFGEESSAEFGEKSEGKASGEDDRIQDVYPRNVQVRMSSKSRWPKGMHDLRPGYGKGIEARPNSGFLFRHVDGLAMENCSVRFADKAGGAFGEAVEFESCRRVRNDRFSELSEE